MVATSPRRTDARAADEAFAERQGIELARFIAVALYCHRCRYAVLHPLAVWRGIRGTHVSVLFDSQ